MTLTEVSVSDSAWHNMTLVVDHENSLTLHLDGVQLGDELDANSVHDFLDPYLTTLALGGFRKEELLTNEVHVGEYGTVVLEFLLHSIYSVLGELMSP